MKYTLISAAHYKRAPYVEDYISHFDRKSIDFDLIYWDRTNLDSDESLEDISLNYQRYSNGKKQVQASFIDYAKYAIFISRKLKSLAKQDDRILIIFTVQLQFLLYPLLKLYRIKYRYINDIRDYHKLSQNKLYKRIFSESEMNIISSEGFREWLPSSCKIMVKHNVSLFDLSHSPNNIKNDVLDSYNNGNLIIGHVGSLSHFEINKKVIINNLLNIKFNYYGDGLEFEKYVELSTKYDNVVIFGRYNREDEVEIYKNFHITNLMLDNRDYNVQTVMANRFYSSLLYLRPSVSFAGSYLADQILKYGLGIVISDAESFNLEFEEKLTDFLLEESFTENAKKYLIEVQEQNNIFYDYFN